MWNYARKCDCISIDVTTFVAIALKQKSWKMPGRRLQPRRERRRWRWKRTGNVSETNHPSQVTQHVSGDSAVTWCVSAGLYFTDFPWRLRRCVDYERERRSRRLHATLALTVRVLRVDVLHETEQDSRQDTTDTGHVPCLLGFLTVC